MNPDLNALHPYPFEKLAALKASLTPPAGLAHIPLTIGEPQHAPYQGALEALIAHQLEMARYPATNGLPALRDAIATWATQRFQLAGLDAERQVLPVNGTREAIFAFVQAALDRTRPAKVAVPNPFYQIYEGATLLAEADRRERLPPRFFSGQRRHLARCADRVYLLAGQPDRRRHATGRVQTADCPGRRARLYHRL